MERGAGVKMTILSVHLSYISLKYSGGEIKPRVLVKIREENLYLMDFSYFTHENLVF